MDLEQLKTRTKEFALQVIKLVQSLPRTRIPDVIGNQLLRAATSVGANYCAAYRASSKVDFISKIAIVEEEADETIYWLELIVISDLVKSEQVQNLVKEANELTAIFSASRKTAKKSTNCQSTNLK